MSIEIILSFEERQQLTIVLGYAMGVALVEGDRSMQRLAITVANAVHRFDPDWITCVIPSVEENDRVN